MRKLLLSAVLVLAAGLAFASQPGTWTYGAGNPSLSSFAMLDMASLGEDTFVGVGIYQGATIDLAWKTTDGGPDLYTILNAADVGGFAILTTTEFFTPTVGVVAGINFIGIKAGIWRSDEAGEPGTWDVVDMGPDYGFGSTVDWVDAVTDTFGVAIGYPNLVLMTNDAGASWTPAPTTPIFGNDVMYNGIDFLDENTGFVTTGLDTTEFKREPARTRDEVVHRTLMRVSPVYRYAYEGDTRNKDKAIVQEAVYKTTDAGQTWVALANNMGYVPYRISMANEQCGVIMTGETAGHANYVLRYTTDGGVTWTAGSQPETVPWSAGSNYNLGDVWMVDCGLGYASAFYGIGGLPLGGAFLVTTDGGATWDWDPSGSTGGGYIGMDGVRKAFGSAGGVGLSCASYIGNANSAPTADAGEDGTATAGVELALDGSGSSDPEGDLLMYKWVQTDGEPVTMVSPFGQAAPFTPNAAGTVTFELTVSDSEFTATDSVTFTVEDVPLDDDSGSDDDADDDDDDDTGGDDSGTPDDDADDDAGDDDDDSEGGCGC